MLRLSRILVPAVLVAAAAAGVYTWMRPEANPAPAVLPAAQAPGAAVGPGSEAGAALRPGGETGVAARPAPKAVPAAALAARSGALAKLVFSEPRPVAETMVTDPSGAQHSLADRRGKWLLVNFWAVWCVPCRVEMPALDALQGEFGGEKFQVVTIASGRNQIQAIDRFFDETGVTRLPKLLDPKMALSAEMGVLGLPVTVLVDPDGYEVARLIGDADWHSDEARTLVRALIAD